MKPKIKKAHEIKIEEICISLIEKIHTKANASALTVEDIYKLSRAIKDLSFVIQGQTVA